MASGSHFECWIRKKYSHTFERLTFANFNSEWTDDDLKIPIWTPFLKRETAAIVDFNAKNWSNHSETIKTEFFDPENPRKHILIDSAAKIIPKLIFKIAHGGHFGFWLLKKFPHIFERCTLANFSKLSSKMINPQKNICSDSTVTEVSEITQL